MPQILTHVDYVTNFASATRITIDNGMYTDLVWGDKVGQ